ncbi:MAG: carboxymuconolactone decarboxylase family protein [Anaerolineales bacterium]|nr:carboxymuconolactone decarboxylase family protein [Anaerolineales bacterium]MCS7247714.1 carboxymuconolactone decarboxylase family protein [Anaerolineales bacterium]MDW8161524.1 carboxymuconolactone decarboxylase family protein [Anaerolineales bacterium]MDW8446860.1 carboxymuconolactone decarboxylase family protein [Anaerolineales bacterium]
MAELPKPYRRFQEQFPEVYRAFEGLGETIARVSCLDQKTRELIRLGMAAASRSESAVQSHTHRALEAGATPQEVEHAILLGITTLGFPTTMAALAWAREAIEDHFEK